ncbi:MAG: tetratricopeptide repeat protein [Chloroflexota bacterium]
MKNNKNFFDKMADSLFSSTQQLQRIVILTGVVLILVIVSFAGYYYYDRFYQGQPKIVEKSITQAEQAIRDDQNNPDLRLNLAEMYMTSTMYDKAIEQITYVMINYPENQRAWFLSGVVNTLNKNYAEAISPLEKYMEAHKDDPIPGLDKTLQSAAYYLGVSYLGLGQPDLAIVPLEKAVDWSKTDSDAMYQLGLAYLRVNKYKESVSMFQKAVLFVPNFTEAYQGMQAAFDAINETDYSNYAQGMIAYSQKDYTKAIEYLQKAALAKPEYTPVFDGLGLTYEGMGDLKNAQTSYEMAVKLDPSDFTATTGLDRVKTLLNK